MTELRNRTSQNVGHSGLAGALLQKVQNDEVRLPLGLIHFLEHLQNESPARRERLAKVLDSYSRGWCYAAWSDICDFEIRQGLAQAFRGAPPARPEVFGRGFMFTASAGGRDILRKDHTRAPIALFTALSAQPGALFDLLTTTIEADRKQQKVSTANLSVDNATAAEELRLRRRGCSREEYRNAQYATSTLEHERVLVDQLSRMQLSMPDFLALGVDGLLKFWSGVPSIHTECELTRRPAMVKEDSAQRRERSSSVGCRYTLL